MSSSRASRRAAAAARHRLLPGGRLAGPMPWIIAIMMFLTVLSAAAGLALGAAVQAMSADLAGRASVQVVEADAAVRDQLAARTLQALRQASEVRAATPVDPAALADQLRPWLGEDAASADLPVPALIDVTLTPGAAQAKVDRHRRYYQRVPPPARQHRAQPADRTPCGVPAPARRTAHRARLAGGRRRRADDGRNRRSRRAGGARRA